MLKMNLKFLIDLNRKNKRLNLIRF